MGDSEAKSGFIPFGAEEEAKEVVAAADPLSSFLTDVAPLLVGALVIAAFLTYQFGRWYLARPRGDLSEVEPTMVPKAAQPVVEESERPAPRSLRPWQAE